MLTKSKPFVLGAIFRFSRFFVTICRLACFSASESIKSFCIPRRKHFAKRQQLHKRRYVYVIGQSPSFGHIK